SQEEPLPSFLEEIALVSDVDEYQDAKPAATLITMHAVKGLEFPVVFMTGMEEGVFHAGHEHDRELEPFDRVHGDERRGGLGVLVLVHVGHERDLLQEAREWLFLG